MQFPRFNRRQMLRLGMGAMALPLPALLGLREAAAKTKDTGDGFGRAKSCIILFAWGGMSHLDTFDPKPAAPAEVRGLFRPIATSVPGIQLCEHLPHLAHKADKLAIVRSVHHRSAAHGKGMYWCLTGHPPSQPDVAANNEATGQDWPCLPSVVTKVKGHPSGIPGCAMLPYQMWDNMTRQGGHDAGWLGRAYDPIILKPTRGKAYGGVSRDNGIASLGLPTGVDRERFDGRNALLNALQTPAQGREADFERSTRPMTSS